MDKGCDDCITLVRSRKKSSGTLRASLSYIGCINQRLLSNSSIRNNNEANVQLNQIISAVSRLRSNETSISNARTSGNRLGLYIDAPTNIDEIKASSRLLSSSKFYNTYTSKVSGPLKTFDRYVFEHPTQIIYPTKDKVICDNENCFVDESGNIVDLYSHIDGGLGYDDSSYIQPSSIHAIGGGPFKYKCEFDNFFIRPDESYLAFRIISPIKDKRTNLVPSYNLTNIKLEDPSGNLIIEYKDINVKGDADYTEPLVNYTTYVTEPKINNANARTWSRDYPILGSGSMTNEGLSITPYTNQFFENGYSVTFDLSSECLDDPFNEGFNLGYEERFCKPFGIERESVDDYLALDGTPISTQSEWYHLRKIADSIRITAIEMANTGPLMNVADFYLKFYMDVSTNATLINRTILPADVLDYDYDTLVPPKVDSVWNSSTTYDGLILDNISGSLLPFIRNSSYGSYITLNDVEESGKLKLKFSHEVPFVDNAFTGGAFQFGFGSPTQNFNNAQYKPVRDVDIYFKIEKIELKIVAKKAEGSDDYGIDVVGWSDDKLLHVTSSVGGFLQNVDGEGNFVATSGFGPIDDLGISSEAMSDKYQYFEASGSNNAGGDHYQLSKIPMVTGTDFQEYTIPLKIYKDNIDIGKSKDYSVSPYFEHLYLDIYPIPNGASIAHAKLIVSYVPSNAMTLHSIGQKSDREMTGRDIKLFPSSGVRNIISNSGILSRIENIPHGYSSPYGINGEETLQTNYHRRWKGSSGNKVVSAFRNSEFDFSFRKDFTPYPFDSYYNFNTILPGNIVHAFNNSSDLSPSPLLGSGAIGYRKSLGSKFISSRLLFDTETLTMDWTSVDGYGDDALFGKIADSYDTFVLVNNINYLYRYDDFPLQSGFSSFIRFIPRPEVSGVGYNLFNSGVIFGQFDSDLSYAVAFDDGHISAYAQDENNNIIQVKDSNTYDEYSYPLSVALTYSEQGDKKLRLYIDNEKPTIINDNLRGASEEFTIKHVPNNALTIGYSRGSGVGMPMVVTDFGTEYTFANDNNVINSKIITDFLGDIRVPYKNQESQYTLWDKVDNDADEWHLGAYRSCHFDNSFDKLSKRVGNDYIFHYLKHDGISYEQICNLDLPSTIPSGLAYHTQIENDMLRFNLAATDNSSRKTLYSPLPRISKSVPRGYDFQKDALSVETLLEYDCFDNVRWNDGNIGPKLMVSLYTTNKDPQTYEAFNYGLINRAIHYLEPSGCFRKISSFFTPDSFLDEENETWSSFNKELRLTEFNHKYFSKDIDDMFVQYDIAYPSGSPFEAMIKLHSVNIRMKNALVEADDSESSLDIYVSGEKVSRNYLDFHTLSHILSSGAFDLYTSGEKFESSGIFNLFGSGGYPVWDYLDLYGHNVGTISNIGNGLFGANDPTFGFSLYVNSRIQDDKFLPLYASVDEFFGDVDGTLSLVAYNKPTRLIENSTLFVYMNASQPLTNFFPFVDMNLYTQGLNLPKETAESVPLFTEVVDTLFTKNDNSMSLFTVNYDPPLGKGEQAVNWTGQNFGVSIDVDDNIYSYLDADDEIRGVTTICYGDCNAGGSCTELEIVTHDTVWRDTTCVNGGIFRPINVYTNPDTIAFRTEVGYDKNFYGIRKYDGLIPNAPYNITVVGYTAGGEIINVPREIDTIEYGLNDEVAYSGIKLVADEPGEVGSRNAGDKYGKSVSVSQNILAVGAPHHTIKDIDGNDILDAGTVFVYRREPEPQGYDWDYDKGEWAFETELRLPFPSGDYIKDEAIVTFRDSNGNKLADVTERLWAVGQEGRQFGHSVSACSFDDKELIAVGGPSAKWSREFEDLEPSGVSVGLFVFTDEFTPEYINNFDTSKNKTYANILRAIKDKDILFKYFAKPFPIKFDVKVVVFDCNADTNGYVPKQFSEPKPEGFVYTKLAHRHYGGEPEDQSDRIFQDMVNAFNEAFPYDETKLNNNIPALIGFHLDTSDSFILDPFNQTTAVDPELDRFIKYYQDYSLANGLVDFYQQPSKGGIAKYYSNSENWITESIDAFNHLLDLERIIVDKQVKFFGESLGEFNKELKEFNDPPPSGGAVYIFENEEDSWNLIQAIESPVVSNIVPPDRFGHAVKFSQNGEVLVVGSPYTNEAFGVYQYDPREKERMFKNVPSWVTFHRENDKSFGYYWRLKDRFDELVEDGLTEDEASRALYKELTPMAKYDLRTNPKFWKSGGLTLTEQTPNYFSGYYATSKTGPIQEYEKIFTYTYGSIPYIGTWGLILNTFCPTSRLGYSVAVNEDGSIVAAGAPTDSLNEYDDRNVYYWQNESDGTIEAYSRWASYVNAGAVRLFESRQYFPHNLVIEYGKFGNLAYENRTESEDPFFEHMEAIFNETINYNTGQRLEFAKTSFEEVDIPEEAGLVFLITPAVDALSDEILTNIKEWLALGDRHLVLVGEDPVYERDGLYEESNNIINKILEGLNSRVRIHPARNNFEALYTDTNLPTRPNILPSTRPGTPRSKARSNYIVAPQTMYAYGVGDIRMHSPNKGSSYACTLSNDPFFANADIGVDDSYQALNGKCKIPMYHEGDIRAEWSEVCYDRQGNRKVYPNNWALLFGTYVTEDYGCYVDDDGPKPPSPTAGYDPIPFLAAAEYPEPYDVIYPAVPPASSLVEVEWENVPVDTRISAKFGTDLNDEKQFIWSSEESKISSASICIGNTSNPDRFIDPFPYNAKDPLLQGVSTSKEISSDIKVPFYSPICHTAREGIGSSHLYLIASLETETEAYLYSEDKNLRYYRNMLSDGFDPGKKLHIAQLGSWTGRRSFAEGKADNSYLGNRKSFLATVFRNFNHTVDEDVVGLNNPRKLVQQEDGSYQSVNINYELDVCWIANPLNLPTQSELEELLTWFNKGNKKIVITYETLGTVDGYDPNYEPTSDVSYDTVNNVSRLCKMLSSTMEPLFLPAENRYALHAIDGQITGNANFLTIRSDSFIGEGFPGTNADNIAQIPYQFFGNNFVPINTGNGQSVAFFTGDILDKAVKTDIIRQMKAGVAEVKFPVLPGSGYRIFVDLAAERFWESVPMIMDISNCTMSPRLENAPGGSAKELYEYDNNDEKVVIKSDSIGFSDQLVSSDFNGETNTRSYLLQASSNAQDMSIYFSANQLRLQDSDNILRTSRLISISGCLVNIEKETQIIYERRVTKYDWVITDPGSPERTETIIPPLRRISTDNTKYCPTRECAEVLGNQLIEDGPIVVAQELEQFSSFKYGENRSRVTVISDSSLIQGRNIADENGAIRDSVRRFLQSLYPPNPSNFVRRGRQFTISTKLINSERMSPQKLFNATQNPGHNLRFLGTYNSMSTNRQPCDYEEYVYDPNETPLRRPRELREALEYDFLIDLPEDTKRTEEQIAEIERNVINTFASKIASYGGTPKFSGYVEGKLYADASYFGGIPEIMNDTGYDYIDFERFPSGYPGDLFGYDIDLYGEKLVVGAPFVSFSGEYITPWESICELFNQGEDIPSTLSSYNGGAGAVYLYEKTGSGLTPQNNLITWNCTRKIRPESINVGQDLFGNDNIDLASEGYYLGDNNYTADDLVNETIVTDQFGKNVKILSDVIVVGAPGHDFGNYIEDVEGEFINKEFTKDFNLRTRNVYDLGESGVRNELFLQGKKADAVLNNGAAYVYENKIYDWPNKLQKWEFVEKIVQQGQNSRLQKTYPGFNPSVGLIAASGSENDYFGTFIDIDRLRRKDSDYNIVFGAPYHKFSTSGNPLTEKPMLDAGTAYSFDIILRKQEASKADPNAFIHARVFGGSGEHPFVRIGFKNGNSYNTRYEATGIVYTNPDGEIFIEGSGQDPLARGFVSQRPYIHSVKGDYVFGSPVHESMKLYIDGQPPLASGDMPLFIDSDYGIVYNTLVLYQNSILDFSSGNMPLYTEAPSGTVYASGLYLGILTAMSGSFDGIGLNTDTLNFTIRGR